MVVVLASTNAEGTVAVFLGLLVEYTILIWPKRKELKRWEKVFTVLAGIAIAGGVYGEYLFGPRAADAALQIENISEHRIADLKAETSGNELRTAELERDNLELTARGESLDSLTRLSNAVRCALANRKQRRAELYLTDRREGRPSQQINVTSLRGDH